MTKNLPVKGYIHGGPLSMGGTPWTMITSPFAVATAASTALIALVGGLIKPLVVR